MKVAQKSTNLGAVRHLLSVSCAIQIMVFMVDTVLRLLENRG